MEQSGARGGMRSGNRRMLGCFVLGRMIACAHSSKGYGEAIKLGKIHFSGPVRSWGNPMIRAAVLLAFLAILAAPAWATPFGKGAGG